MLDPIEVMELSPSSRFENVSVFQDCLEADHIRRWTFGLYGAAVESEHERELAICQQPLLVRTWGGG